MPWRILAQIDAGEISSLALISNAKNAPWEAIILAGEPGDERKGQ